MAPCGPITTMCGVGVGVIYLDTCCPAVGRSYLDTDRHTSRLVPACQIPDIERSAVGWLEGTRCRLRSIPLEQKTPSSALPTAKFIERFMDFVQIQWNPSELDTKGRKEGRKKENVLCNDTLNISLSLPSNQIHRTFM